jgi:hypothetical protein
MDHETRHAHEDDYTYEIDQEIMLDIISSMDVYDVCKQLGILKRLDADMQEREDILARLKG